MIDNKNKLALAWNNYFQQTTKGGRKVMGGVWIFIFLFVGLSYILYNGSLSVEDFAEIDNKRQQNSHSQLQHHHNSVNESRLMASSSSSSNFTTMNNSSWHLHHNSTHNLTNTTTSLFNNFSANISSATSSNINHTSIIPNTLLLLRDTLSPVHVLFGLSGNHPGFIAEFEVALKSILMNAPIERNLQVHVMGDDKAFGALQKVFDRTEVATWKTRNHITIHTYDITEYIPEWRKRISKTFYWTHQGASFAAHTIGCFFRLFAHQVLPANVGHVLYLDTDVVVMTNLDELWNFVNDTAAFQWGIGMCSGFVLMNMHRMDDIWNLADQSPLKNISQEYKHVGDQLIFMAVNITFPNEISLLPDGWDMTVTEKWRQKFQPYETKIPNVGMLHLNGGGASKEAYFETHSFLTGFAESWGNAKYYATMPWTWARYRAKSVIPPGQDGFDLIVHHNTTKPTVQKTPPATAANNNATTTTTSANTKNNNNNKIIQLVPKNKTKPIQKSTPPPPATNTTTTTTTTNNDNNETQTIISNTTTTTNKRQI